MYVKVVDSQFQQLTLAQPTPILKQNATSVQLLISLDSPVTSNSNSTQKSNNVCFINIRSIVNKINVFQNYGYSSSLFGQSPFSSDFCNAIFDLNLHQLIKDPTHIAGNILDLILTNAPDNIFNLSDHFIISFDHSTPPNSLINTFKEMSSTFPRWL